MFISYRYKYEKNKKFGKYIIVFLVIFNIVVISTSLYSDKGKGYAEEFIKNDEVEEKYATSNGKIQNFREAIEYIKVNDNEFYRIAKKDISYQNLSLIYDYNPVQLYLSLGNQYVYGLSKDLEDNCYASTKCVNGADRRTKYLTVLSNKYYICDKKDSRYVPYGYTLYHEIGNTQIYINENYLPAGVIYNSYITKEQFESLSPLEKEDSLITAAVVEGINNSNSENVKINKPMSLKYIVNNQKMENNCINIDENNDSIEILIEDIPKNHELYLSIYNIKNILDKNRTDFKITAKIDGIKNSEDVKNKISSAYYMENPNFLINLGVTKKGQSNKLKITFNKKGTYAFDSFEILAVDMIKYEKKIEKLNVLKDVEYGNDYITGNTNTKDDGILQIATSYSEGWKAYVDNKEVEVLKVNEAFIGIELEAGIHNVRFEYETPYLKLGIIFSLIGVSLYICLIKANIKK